MIAEVQAPLVVIGIVFVLCCLLIALKEYVR
jgi:hypothetical protein